jgi:prevent-host-death family protein
MTQHATVLESAFMTCYPRVCDYLERQMPTVTLADAESRLSALIDEATEGDPVLITRDGKPVARIVAVHPPGKPIDVAALRALTDSMTMQPESAGDFIRKMRDDYRY